MPQVIFLKNFVSLGKFQINWLFFPMALLVEAATTIAMEGVPAFASEAAGTCVVRLFIGSFIIECGAAPPNLPKGEELG